MSGSFSDQYRQPRPALRTTSRRSRSQGTAARRLCEIQAKAPNLYWDPQSVNSTKPRGLSMQAKRGSLQLVQLYHIFHPQATLHAIITTQLITIHHLAVSSTLVSFTKIGQPRPGPSPGILVLVGVSTPRVSQGCTSLTPFITAN